MKEPLFNRGFALCTFSCFFFTVMFFMFFSDIASYSEDVLGAGHVLAGAVVSMFVVGDMVARLFMGRFLGTIGERRVALTAFSLAALVSVPYLLVHNLVVFIILRVVQGFLYGAGASAVSTMVTKNLPDSRRGEGLGYYMLSVSLGSAIGPFLCMWLCENVSYDSTFILGIAVTVAAALCVLPLRDPVRTGDVDRVGLVPRISEIIEFSALPMSVVCFVLFLSYSGVLSFMNNYGAEIGLVSAASVFFVFISVTTLISRLFLCRISDVHGDNWALLPFFVLFIGGMFLLSKATSDWMLLCAGLMMGFLIAQFVAVGQAAVVRNVSKSRYGVAVCTFNVFLDLSYAIGPMTNGYFIGELGYRGNYELMAFVAVFALVLYLVVHGIPEMRRRSR